MSLSNLTARHPSLTIARMKQAAAIEDVVADLGGAFQGRGPVGAYRYRVEIGGAAGGVFEPDFAGQDLGRQFFRLAPGRNLFRTQDFAIAGERELAAGMGGALIDHGADRMAVIAGVHA